VAQAVRGRRLGQPLLYRYEVDSTMNVCRDLLRAGAAEGTVVVADAQTAGRGKPGRTWQTPPCASLLFSVILRPPPPAERWPLVIWPVSLAVVEAVRQVADVEACIKWPNDVVVQDRKLAGVLAEQYPEGVVAGVGLNVNFSAADLALDQAITTLQDETGTPVSREKLLSTCLRSLSVWYARWLAEPEAVWQAWRERSVLLGRHVTLTTPSAALVGQVVDLDASGHLCVQLPDGTLQRFATGEASVRPAIRREQGQVSFPPES